MEKPVNREMLLTVLHKLQIKDGPIQ